MLSPLLFPLSPLSPLLFPLSPLFLSRFPPLSRLLPSPFFPTFPLAFRPSPARCAPSSFPPSSSSLSPPIP